MQRDSLHKMGIANDWLTRSLELQRLSKSASLLGRTEVLPVRGADGTKRISPNHSWRHRLTTLGRRHGLAVDILDAMTGHGRKMVADRYGEFPSKAMLRELSKIPQVNL